MAVQKTTRKPDYSDLDLDFLVHPTTHDILKKTGVDAIKRSIRNLVLTNFYDRPFRSAIGSNAQKILFDNINPLTANFLKDAVAEVINNFEPRVKIAENIPGQSVNGIKVTVDMENNGYSVTIPFIIINRGEPAIINLFLERIR